MDPQSKRSSPKLPYRDIYMQPPVLEVPRLKNFESPSLLKRIMRVSAYLTRVWGKGRKTPIFHV